MAIFDIGIDKLEIDDLNDQRLRRLVRYADDHKYIFLHKISFEGCVHRCSRLMHLQGGLTPENAKTSK